MLATTLFAADYIMIVTLVSRIHHPVTPLPDLYTVPTWGPSTDCVDPEAPYASSKATQPHCT